MTEYEVKRSDKIPPAHPGAILSDVFEGLGLTNTETARRLGIARQHLFDVLAERKPVSANIAVRIGEFLGQNGGILLRMPAACDLWHAENSADLAQVVIWSASSHVNKRKPKKGHPAV